jgi:hypothetical protein
MAHMLASMLATMLARRRQARARPAILTGSWVAVLIGGFNRPQRPGMLLTDGRTWETMSPGQWD